jgi:dihydrofolate reductase
MRKIFAFLMVTLDGYQAAANGDLFWHNVDEEFHDFAVAQLDEADTLVFGRTTYLGMAEFWPSAAAAEVDPRTAERMNGYAKVVVSTTLASAGWGPATIVRRDVPAELGKLKEQPGRDIALLGSSALAASLLGTGVIDEVRLMVNPVVLGSGRPALAGANRTDMELVRTRQFSSGNILLVHRPRP